MHIINGKFKGKKLYLPNISITRPSKNIVKKALFDILINRFSFNFQKKYVIDMCSGSGPLGLESLSLGAYHVTFIENDTNTAKILKKNINLIKAFECTTIIQKKVEQIKFLKNFDLAFFDPPYKEISIIEMGLKLLSNFLKSNAIICIETSKKNNQIKSPNNLNILDERIYGNTKIIFLKNI